MSTPLTIDALLPPEIAKRAAEVGAHKCRLPFWPLLTLAVLAGAFIALGAVFSTTVSAGTGGAVPFGLARLLTGIVFCLGLVLVVIAGAELFTGNALISPIGLLIKSDTPFLTVLGKSPTDYANLTWSNFLLVNLLPVTVGNLIGGVALVGLVYWFIYLRAERALVSLPAYGETRGDSPPPGTSRQIPSSPQR